MKSRAFSWCTRHLNESAMILYYPIDRSQTQSGAPSHFFGSEEWVKNLLPCGFIHAHTGDREGNLRYKLTARNFNPVMAAASRITIAEVENLVEPGELGPDDIHTPGIYVQRVVVVPRVTFPVTID